jgi:hypothetical protein
MPMILWLDSNEDVSRYLRGSISHGSTAELKSELFFELLLLLVICGLLAVVLIVGAIYLRQGCLVIGNKAIKGPIQRWRLTRRIRAVARDLREGANEGVVQSKGS